MGKLEFLYRSELPPRAIAVYLYLNDRAGIEGMCYPSIPTIARHTGLSQSTVRRAIKDLTATGFLTVEQRFRKSGADSLNLYQLRVPP